MNEIKIKMYILIEKPLNGFLQHGIVCRLPDHFIILWKNKISVI